MIDLKKFFKINMGLILLGIGLYFFLLPSKLVVGGISGLALTVSYYFPNIQIGAIMFITNIFLLTLAFILLGKEFGGYTVYSSLAISGIIFTLEKIYPLQGPLVDDLLINLLYGIVITGVGIAIIFYQNASTGGTDIIAKIINKYTNIEIGKSLLLADFLIVLFAGATFGAKLGMYALMGVVINAFVIDNMIAGFDKKLNIMINSKKYEEINRFILEEIDRGTTIYHAEGGYSKTPRVIINSVVSKKEYLRIKQFAKQVDPNVFMTLNFSNEVHGEGFN